MPSLAENIVKALGIDPQQLRAALNNVIATANRVDANMAAAQEAIKQATGHFDRRLADLEIQMARMVADNDPHAKSNGAIPDDRSSPASLPGKPGVAVSTDGTGGSPAGQPAEPG